MVYNLDLLNNKEHRFIPYIIISLNNLFSYAGESYEKLSIQDKEVEMKDVLRKVGDHGQRHFEINSSILFLNEKLDDKKAKDLILIGAVLIDIRNWIFHPEQKQEPKIKRICKRLNIDASYFFKIIWKIISCFLYKKELIEFISELDGIYGSEQVSEKEKANFCKSNFYLVSDSFMLATNSLDSYSLMCQKTFTFLENKQISLNLKNEWNLFLNSHYKYSNFIFDYDYFNKKLLISTRNNQDYLTINNLECSNLKKLKISKLFYNAIVSVQEITFEEFQASDSGFITNKYKNLIKEIYKVLKIKARFKESCSALKERLNNRHLLLPNSLNFIQEIDLFEIRNQVFHFSYKKEQEQEIYSQFFYLIAHLESKKSKIQKIEEDLSAKINHYLENSQNNKIFFF